MSVAPLHSRRRQLLRSIADLTPVAALAVGLFAITWANLLPAAPTAEQLLLCGKFLLAAIFFGTVGLFASRMLSPEPRAALCASPPMLILFGQAIAVAWVLVRSACNSILPQAIPIGWADVLLIGAALTLQRYRSAPQSQNPYTKPACVESLPALIPALTIFIVVLLFLVLHELPRQVMLSSDPDQHAFFAQQILRFGTIPFSQGMWGPEPLHYPAGFAVINFLWCKFGGLDPRAVVALQPFLQTLLALGAVSSASALFLRFRPNPAFSAALWLFLFACYLRFIPFGFERGHFHLEGSGRMAAIGTFATSLWFLLATPNQARTDPVNLSGATVLGLVAGISALINPAAVFLPLLTVVLSVSIVLFVAHSMKRFVLGSLVAACAFIIVLLGDPYYLNRLGAQHRSPTVTVLALTPAQSTPFIDRAFSALYEANLGTWWERYTDLGTIPYAHTCWVLLGLACLALAVALFSNQRVSTLKSLGALYAMLFYFFPPFIALSACFSQVSPTGDLFLLGPYFAGTAHQWVFLAMATLLSAVVHLLTQIPSTPLAASLAISLGITLLNLDSTAINVDLRPRGEYCGAAGCATSDDLALAGKIQSLFRSYRAAGGSLAYRTVPKILVPNMVANTGLEQWLFPYGGSRILPHYDTFPLAFYYFQGHSDYSIKNYNRFVCRNFRKKWLLERGIRYVYLSADLGPVCLGQLLKDPIPERAVALQSGPAKLVDLEKLAMTHSTSLLRVLEEPGYKRDSV